MRIPLATYRLQFGPTLRFADARALVPYLAELGISDLYASPIFRATPGSTHGYDVTDPNELNPELGTPEEFQALVDEVRAHGMGWLQDIVPNHMAYSSENRMLMDVFENGPRSRYYDFFDIFHDHPDPGLRTRVLAPFLGSPLEEVLRQGQLQLVLDDDGLAVRYFAWRFPLCLASYDDVLGHGDPMSGSGSPTQKGPPPAMDRRWEPNFTLGVPAQAGDGVPNANRCVGGPDDPGMQAFTALREALARLSETEDSPEKRRQVADAKRTLVQLHRKHPMVRLYLDGILDSYHFSHEGVWGPLLERQFFQPVFWQVAYETINYRRFFYLSDFIALRTEQPQVFESVHRKVLELVRAGVFTGLRVDHIDGLYNPRQYLRRLHEATPQTYLVVEKILELYEFLRTEWPIQGTSGYQFCNYVNGIFCQRENGQVFTNIYREFIGAEAEYQQLLYDEKRKVLEWHMGGELAYLTHLALQAAQELEAAEGENVDDDSPSFEESHEQAARGTATLSHPKSSLRSLQQAASIRSALTALMAAFPVYRTYVDAHHSTREDRAILSHAIEQARDKCPECRPGVDHLVKLLLSALEEESDTATRQARRYFLMRFQQFTGPAMAKGFEDTLLYVYNRFLALNDVGGDPSRFGLSLDEFHHFLQRRARDWPHAMNATSTHDSKRGEDVRARLQVLSEIPDRWRDAVWRWARMNEHHKQRQGGMLAPDRNDEYLLYQTLVGAWPEEERNDGMMEYWNNGGRKGDNPPSGDPHIPSRQYSDAPTSLPPTAPALTPEALDEFRQRIKDYLVKAIREAKVHGNWLGPDEGYEEACRQFLDRILDRTPGNPFWADFLPFQQEIAAYGVYNSLSQTVLKITCPGLPDFYQGSELWDLNLVDPDNRRPVDFEKRAQLLRAVRPGPVADLGSRRDGAGKLLLIHRALRLRRQNRALFDTGEHLPAVVTGRHAPQVVAFFRVASIAPRSASHVLVVAPRFLTPLVEPGQPPLGRQVWEDTAIALPDDAPRAWHHAITEETLEAQGSLPVGDILAQFPVAILVAKAPNST